MPTTEKDDNLGFSALVRALDRKYGHTYETVKDTELATPKRLPPLLLTPNLLSLVKDK